MLVLDRSYRLRDKIQPHFKWSLLSEDWNCIQSVGHTLGIFRNLKTLKPALSSHYGHNVASVHTVVIESQRKAFWSVPRINVVIPCLSLFPQCYLVSGCWIYDSQSYTSILFSVGCQVRFYESERVNSKFSRCEDVTLHIYLWMKNQQHNIVFHYIDGLAQVCSNSSA